MGFLSDRVYLPQRLRSLEVKAGGKMLARSPIDGRWSTINMELKPSAIKKKGPLLVTGGHGIVIASDGRCLNVIKTSLAIAKVTFPR